MGGLGKLVTMIGRFFPSVLRSIRSLRSWLMRRKWGQWLIFYMAGAVGLMIEKIIFFLGVSFVAYTWATPALVEYVAGPMLGLPPQWQAFLAMTRIDDATTVILSALVYRVTTSFKVERNANSPFWGNMTTTP